MSSCDSVVEHRSAESEGLRFDSLWGLRIFYLSQVCEETKNILLWSREGCITSRLYYDDKKPNFLHCYLKKKIGTYYVNDAWYHISPNYLATLRIVYSCGNFTLNLLENENCLLSTSQHCYLLQLSSRREEHLERTIDDKVFSKKILKQNSSAFYSLYMEQLWISL